MQIPVLRGGLVLFKVTLRLVFKEGFLLVLLALGLAMQGYQREDFRKKDFFQDCKERVIDCK